MLTGQGLLRVQDGGIVNIPSCTLITFANGTLTNLGGGRASFSAPSTMNIYKNIITLLLLWGVKC